jgi:hypothetical protein
VVRGNGWPRATAAPELSLSRTSRRCPAGLRAPVCRLRIQALTVPRPEVPHRSPSCPNGGYRKCRGTSIGRSGSGAPCRPARGVGPPVRRTGGTDARRHSPSRPQRGRCRTGRDPSDPTHGRLGRDRGPKTKPLRLSPGEVRGSQMAASGAVDRDQGAVAPADNCRETALRAGLPGDTLAGTHAVLFLAAESEGRGTERDRVLIREAPGSTRGTHGVAQQHSMRSTFPECVTRGARRGPR